MPAGHCWIHAKPGMIAGMHAHRPPLSHHLQWSSRLEHVAAIAAAQAEAYALGCSGRDTGVDEQHLLALAPSNKRAKTADAHRHAARPPAYTPLAFMCLLCRQMCQSAVELSSMPWVLSLDRLQEARLSD